MKHLYEYMSARSHQFQDWLAQAVEYHKQSGTLPHIPQPPLTADAVTRATRPNLDPKPPVEEPVSEVPLSSLPADCFLANIPGAPGLVYLEVPDGTMYGKHAHAIPEVRDSFPKGSPEELFLTPQIDNAQILSRVNYPATFEPACQPVDPNTGRVTGHDNFPNTLAWTPTSGRDDVPLFYSVAQVIAKLESLTPAKGDGGGSFSPPA